MAQIRATARASSGSKRARLKASRQEPEFAVVNDPVKTSDALYSVSEAAKFVDCSPSSLRRWEQEGLVSPLRTSGGFRRYDHLGLERLLQIARLRKQQLNMSAIRRMLPSIQNIDRTKQRGETRAIGARLHRLRREHGYSLKSAGELGGISPSFLSTVERGQNGVSIGKLRRLLEVYKTTLTEFLLGAEGPQGQRLVRSSDRPLVLNEFGGVTIEQLARGRPAMDVQLVTVEPGGESLESYSHVGEEFIFVLEGEFDIEIGGQERYHLEREDCLYFPSELSHSWRNNGRRKARLLWAATPPSM